MPNVAMNLVIMADVWHSVPFIALILQAALATLPIDLDEAAEVDGATAFSASCSSACPCFGLPSWSR